MRLVIAILLVTSIAAYDITEDSLPHYIKFFIGDSRTKSHPTVRSPSISASEDGRNSFTYHTPQKFQYANHLPVFYTGANVPGNMLEISGKKTTYVSPKNISTIYNELKLHYATLYSLTSTHQIFEKKMMVEHLAQIGNKMHPTQTAFCNGTGYLPYWHTSLGGMLGNKTFPPDGKYGFYPITFNGTLTTNHKHPSLAYYCFRSERDTASPVVVVASPGVNRVIFTQAYSMEDLIATGTHHVGFSYNQCDQAYEISLIQKEACSEVAKCLFFRINNRTCYHGEKNNPSHNDPDELSLLGQHERKQYIPLAAATIPMDYSYNRKGQSTAQAQRLYSTIITDAIILEKMIEFHMEIQRLIQVVLHGSLNSLVEQMKTWLIAIGVALFIIIFFSFLNFMKILKKKDRTQNYRVFYKKGSAERFYNLKLAYAIKPNKIHSTTSEGGGSVLFYRNNQIATIDGEATRICDNKGQMLVSFGEPDMFSASGDNIPLLPRQ